jgi:hypothetical protein
MRPIPPQKNADTPMTNKKPRAGMGSVPCLTWLAVAVCEAPQWFLRGASVASACCMAVSVFSLEQDVAAGRNPVVLALIHSLTYKADRERKPSVSRLRASNYST